MIRIEYMVEFMDLMDTLNFTETARNLYLTQPALSRHVSLLEKELGVTLLNRTSHDVAATDAGRAVYEDFKRIVADYNEMLSDVSTLARTATGSLNIGLLYYETSELPGRLIEAFRDRYPDLGISVRSCQGYQTFEYLRQQLIDVGCAYAPLEDASPIDYGFFPLIEERLVALMPDDHPLASRESVSWEDLTGQTLVQISLEKEGRQAFSKHLAERGVKPAKTVMTEQIDTMPATLRRVGGVFIGPETLRNMPGHDLTILPITPDEAFSSMGLVYRKDSSNPSLATLIDFAHAFLDAER